MVGRPDGLGRPAPVRRPAFLDRLRAATALLEEIVADRPLLAGVPANDQRRLLQAAGRLYSAYAIACRRLVRATTDGSSPAGP
jgi:hypothetical protein